MLLLSKTRRLFRSEFTLLKPMHHGKKFCKGVYQDDFRQLSALRLELTSLTKIISPYEHQEATTQLRLFARVLSYFQVVTSWTFEVNLG